MCTEVSSSMILTWKTKLVLIRFKQVHFPLQWLVSQCKSHFVLEIVCLHFHTAILLRYFVVLRFSVGVLQKKKPCNDFKQKKK